VRLALQVVKFECQRQPEALGASVFGYNQIYGVLQPFVRRWKEAASKSATPLTPYIISVDVARAFDCIDAEKLTPLLGGLLQFPDYTLVKYVEVRRPSRWKITHEVSPFVFMRFNHHELHSAVLSTSPAFRVACTA
jgi:hypothetical protein